jgi:two-component system NtrC family response regulator
MTMEDMTLDEAERQQILRTLEKYDNNLTQVAMVLGLTRQTLYRRLEKHNIKIEA